jgi:lysophospholipase L1-like esterase
LIDHIGGHEDGPVNRRDSLSLGVLATVLGVLFGGCAAGDDEPEHAALPQFEAPAGPEQSPGASTAEHDDTSPRRSPSRSKQPDSTPEPYEPRPGDPTEAEHPLEDPTGDALQPFFAALTEIDRGESDRLVRVTHMGDSGIDLDQAPHFVRTRLQDRFGDGGAGFVVMQPHSSNYRNRMVKLNVPSDWNVCSILEQCRDDGFYGLGGVVTASSGGAATVVRTRRTGEHGRTASRVELWYAVQPGGGQIQMDISSYGTVKLDTEARRLDDRWHEVNLEPGPKRIRVRAAGGGDVRVYGMVLESEGPGVVWDTISMSGAFTPRVLEHDRAHFSRQLAHRAPDLVVLTYGGNDLRRYLAGAVTPEEFGQETRTLLTRVKRAAPDAACLLTGILDHGRSGPMRVRSRHVETLVAQQRKAASKAGCAFFDAFEAMGGPGSMREWADRGLAAGDLQHLTLEGRKRFAGWIHEGLMAGYHDYRQRQAE